MVDIRICIDAGFMLGEVPNWDVATQTLWFIDGLAGKLLSCKADGSQLASWDMGCVIGSYALREGGGVIVALETGLHTFDPASGAFDLIAHPEAGKDGVRLNDGRVDAQGRFVVGSLDLGSLEQNRAPDSSAGTLYRLDRDLSLHVLASGITISNGIAWSPDDRTFYFADCMIDRIYAYDWDADNGIPSNRRLFAQTENGAIPDGACIDEDGGYWFVTNGAATGVGEVRRLAPDGTLDRVVTMPVPCPTSLCFGGPDLDVLYVTTMNMPTVAKASPHDGALFTIHGTGARGLPQRRFAG